MYELVIAKDLACRNKRVLMQGSYGEISEVTAKFNNSNDIRKLFPKLVAEFEYDFRDSGDIVIVDLDRVNNEKYPHPRMKVIYKDDKLLFDKLLKIPKEKDSYYDKWCDFWRKLQYNKDAKTPLFKEDTNQNEVDEFYRRVNNRIREYDKDFALQSFEFTLNLYNMSKWYCDNWNSRYVSNNQFITGVFADFKRKIKALKDEYYMMVNVVTKAYNIYKDRADYIYRAEWVSAQGIYDNEANIDRSSHSMLYQELYKYIYIKDALFLNEYFKNNPDSIFELTYDEKEEIKNIIKPVKRIK